ncbi:MAG: hypothetical protein GYA00_02855 [Parcubacteria group bacterium]|nr:hypothetical protein [Parcubacteria group bacterium]
MFKIKKLLLLVLIATIVFSCFFPFEAISAFWSEAYDLISDPIGTISAAIMNVIIDIVAGICEFILGLASQMLTWSITAGGIDQTGRESPAVTEGWNLTRGLANSALIIGLVIIAINIILGKEEEQAKKTLINFVIIALLINFTPLICGFLIEGANIIARGFVGEGITNEMSNQLLNGLASVKNGNLLETLILVLFLLVFSIISFVVHILYSLLFLARTVILWILIIVSPIALATKVFPKSNAVKKFFPSILYWDDWYEMFLQWVIIVVPAAIFIHLSNIVIRASIVTEPIKESESLGNYLMNMGFSLMLPLIFLIVGFMVTISSGGKIAAPIGGLGKKAWAATAGAAGGYVIGKASAGASKVAKGAKATGTWAKEGTIGMAAAPFVGQKPWSKEGRDSGRAGVDKVKASVSGAVGKGKDYLRIGEKNTWAKRSAETEKQLKEGMDNYFDGTPEENVAKFKMAQQQIEKARRSGSLSKKDLSKQAENLFVAAANNGDIKDDAILEFLETSKGKGIEVDYGKMLRGTSATEIIKKFKPTALERGFIAKELVETPQGEFIRQDRRSTQAHSVALIKGIEKSKSTEAQSKAALDIGSTLSPGDYKNNYEQIVTAKLDQLREKEQREGLTDKEKEQAANMAEFLRK